jgi:MYND finger
MRPIVDFLSRFIECLVPLPVDRETMSLVRRARSVLQESYSNITTQCHTITDIQQRYKLFLTHQLLCSMEQWHEIHKESEQAQWKRFHDNRLSGLDAASEANTKQFAKNFRKEGRKLLNAQRNLQDGEMCANCFVLEKELLDESPSQSQGLMKCGKCQQIKYCSKECQREHWKKAHKKQCCKKVEKKAAPKSSSESKS